VGRKEHDGRRTVMPVGEVLRRKSQARTVLVDKKKIEDDAAHMAPRRQFKLLYMH